MPKLTVDQQSLKFAVAQIKGLSRRLKPAKAVAVRNAGVVLRDAVRKNISVPPIGGSPEAHYAALVALGHPYARRRGSIALKPTGGVHGAPAEALVHKVSGDLVRSFYGRFSARGPAFIIGFDTNRAPHARYVVQGTRVMLPRDVLSETAAIPAVRKAMRREVVRAFGQIMRTRAAIRLG